MGISFRSGIHLLLCQGNSHCCIRSILYGMAVKGLCANKIRSPSIQTEKVLGNADSRTYMALCLYCIA